jgi:nucleoside-diphosphate-sugar epimerase
MTLVFSKALVTGGAGFIGSHLVSSLVNEGCSVTVLDNLSSGHRRNLAAVAHCVQFVEGDIQDPTALARSMEGCQVVFHHAAVVSVTKTVEAPVSSTLVNDLGTLQVLDAARRNGVGRVVLASSSAVYGDDPDMPKTESMPAKPMSPYAVQKLTNEYYAALYHRLYGLQTCCLRYFNVFGPRQDPSSPYSGVISIFMTKAVRDESPVIFGDGRQTRDFVYVQDVVRANLLAARQEKAVGNVFNVGTSHAVSIAALWDQIARLAGCTRKPRYEAPRPGDIVDSSADIQKARRLLGFDPAFELHQGLEHTFAWYNEAL